jgi:hypothetical protein
VVCHIDGKMNCRLSQGLLSLKCESQSNEQEPSDFNSGCSVADTGDDMSDWIGVDDQLPTSNNEVEIAFFDGCYMCRIFGAYEASNWWLGDEILEDVTHWREATPLPELPKEFDYDW